MIKKEHQKFYLQEDVSFRSHKQPSEKSYIERNCEAAIFIFKGLSGRKGFLVANPFVVIHFGESLTITQNAFPALSFPQKHGNVSLTVFRRSQRAGWGQYEWTPVDIATDDRSASLPM